MNFYKPNYLEKLPLSIMSIVVVAAFPALFLYFQNADEANLSEIAFPLLVDRKSVV